MASSSQVTNRVLMIRPKAFGSNPETAKDNAFQSLQTDENTELIKTQAITEFDQLVVTLTSHGIEVNIEQDTDEPITPDAVFPNNWISFHTSTHGCPLIITYPMMSQARRSERRQDMIDKWTRLLSTDRIDLSSYENSKEFLEGTGSMVLDRVNKVAYACISCRTYQNLLEHICSLLNYSCMTFHACQRTPEGIDVPVYHTNVMMSIGQDLVIICLESIRDKGERKRVRESLEKTGRTCVVISENQMCCFAGNVLELCNKDGDKFLVLSTKAYNSLEPDQITLIKQCGNQLIHSPIDTIEKYGGGGVRCMLAEIFPPNKISL